MAKFAATDRWQQGLRAIATLVAGPPRAGPYLNLGWSALILLGVGLVGARRMASRPGGAVYLVWCIAGGAITALHLFDPANGSMLTLWAGTLGRLVAPSLAAWMVLTALVDERPVRILLVAALAAEYFLRAPWKWPHEVWVPTAILVGCMALCALGLGTRRGEGRRRFAWIAASCVVTLALARGLHAAHRYDVYRLLAERRLDGFDRSAPVDDWPAWQRLDADLPVTIAASAGWDELAGQNWFRYPLLGSRLQNRVVYLPISSDGSIASYADRDALRRAADRRAWLARLARADVDWVIVTSGPSIEEEWIHELPRVFAIDASSSPRNGVLARVDRRNLAEQLERMD
jgi:hypothetical protein